MKPVGLAIGSGAHRDANLRRRGLPRLLDLLQGATIFDRHDFDELVLPVRPVVEDHARARTLRQPRVPLDHPPQQANVVFVQRIGEFDRLIGIDRTVLALERLELDHRGIAARLEVAAFVEHVGDAAAHAGGEIGARVAEHGDDAAGHVFAAMRAGAFDNRHRARVAHSEAFAGDAAEIAFAADRAVKHGVADDDALVARQLAVARRIDDQPAARQALAGVVVGRAFERESDAVRQEAAERLAAGALEANVDGGVRQAGVAIAPRYFAGQHGADGPVDVAHWQLDRDLLTLFQRRLGERDQLVIERLFEPVVLRLALIGLGAGRYLRPIEHAAEIDLPRLRVVRAAAHHQLVGAADHLVEGAEAQFGHQLARLFGDEAQERDHVLGLADEAFAQLLILGRDADRTGVEVALAHHHTTFGDQRRGGEAEFIGAEQRADDDVAAGAQTAVDLHRDAAAQAVQHQRLVR